ncbi:unnamed protein product [Caenorhabditis auriculariae]|uniref:Uncharacterized protein n=1 Tax=Caenorhabditis auriculariae TaxID=2777116 RepID=A0A8S1HI45_9PELO|nr:unnamed protein product [Caenorhabditis auriculariae]
MADFTSHSQLLIIVLCSTFVLFAAMEIPETTVETSPATITTRMEATTKKTTSTTAKQPQNVIVLQVGNFDSSAGSQKGKVDGNDECQTNNECFHCCAVQVGYCMTGKCFCVFGTTLPPATVTTPAPATQPFLQIQYPILPPPIMQVSNPYAFQPIPVAYDPYAFTNSKAVKNNPKVSGFAPTPVGFDPEHDQFLF